MNTAQLVIGVSVLLFSIREIYSAGFDPLKAADDLNQSIITNDLATVRDLLGSGISPNVRDSDGMYPIEATLIMHNCEAFRLLMEYGADPALSGERGAPMYKTILGTGNKTLIKILHSYAPELSIEHNRKTDAQG